MSGLAETFFDALTTAVLLGSERASPPQVAPPGRLAGRAAQVSADDREGALLDLAAAASPWRRAGYAPDQAGLPQNPSPPDDRPPCPPGAAAILARLLRGEQRDVLPEWLELARARNMSVPYDAIPDLLEVARLNPALRELVIAVVGPRGRWLAAMNAEWSFASLSDTSTPEELWQTGTLEQRLALLRGLRRRDAARALALVQSTWAADPPDDRAKFLPELASGLSMADEPFLESCLDDRRKPVRTAAAALLARLPESRFVARMIQRAMPLLAYEPSRNKSAAGRITTTLPSAFDKSWARDGVEEKSPQGMGERAWWLQQILSMTLPAAWSDAWRAEPAALLAAAKESEWGAALITAWAAATVTFADQDWAEALLAWWVDNLRSKAQQYVHYAPLLATLEPPRRERFLLGLLRETERARVGTLIERMDHEWSSEFSLAILRHCASSKPTFDLAQCIDRFHHTLVSEVLAHLDQAGMMDKLTSDQKRRLARLEIRAQMHREFNP